MTIKIIFLRMINININYIFENDVSDNVIETVNKVRNNINKTTEKMSDGLVWMRLLTIKNYLRRIFLILL